MPVGNVESRFRRNNNVNNNLQGDAIVAAINILNKGRIITHPTEAIFGIGYDPDNGTAMMWLLGLEQRPVNKGLILIAANYEQLEPYTDNTMLTDARCEAIFPRWPGPITFAFPTPATTPRWLTGYFDSLVTRVTDHPLAAALC